MSVPAAWVSQANVNLSILKVLDDRIGRHPPYDAVSAPPFGRLFWQDALADPTRLNEENGSPLQYWFEINVIDEGVLRKVSTMVQIDVYYRVGEIGSQSTGDRFGHKITRLIDDLQERLAPLDVGWPFYTFDLSGNTPQRVSGVYLQLKNQQGINGVFSSRKPLPIIDGLRKTALTLDVWHVLDLTKAQPYVRGSSA